MQNMSEILLVSSCLKSLLPGGKQDGASYSLFYSTQCAKGGGHRDCPSETRGDIQSLVVGLQYFGDDMPSSII